MSDEPRDWPYAVNIAPGDSYGGGPPCGAVVDNVACEKRAGHTGPPCNDPWHSGRARLTWRDKAR